MSEPIGPGDDAWYLANPARAVAELRRLQKAALAALQALDFIAGSSYDSGGYARDACEELRTAINHPPG